jgi:hypothetical protein
MVCYQRIGCLIIQTKLREIGTYTVQLNSSVGTAAVILYDSAPEFSYMDGDHRIIYTYVYALWQNCEFRGNFDVGVGGGGVVFPRLASMQLIGQASRPNRENSHIIINHKELR